MNYELARELKENGLPQNTEKSYCLTKRGVVINKTPSKKQAQQMDLVGVDVYAKPTLERLIAACGNDILGLNRTHDDSGEPNGWVADTHTHACDCGKDNCFDFNWEHESGATPTEAVARLWLVINKKT